MAEKFEQETTPDGLPKWEYKKVHTKQDELIEKLGNEGWEAVGGGDNTIFFKRPMKKKELPSYDYGR